MGAMRTRSTALFRADGVASSGNGAFRTSVHANLKEDSMKFSRRRFIAVSTVLASALAVGRRATADAGAGVQETDANAQALGYRRMPAASIMRSTRNSTRATPVRMPVLPGQGRRHDGACAIFGGKQVNAKGWCNSYTKRRSQAGMTWRPCNRNAVVAGVVAREYRPVSEHAERRRPDRPRAPWRTPTRCAGSSIQCERQPACASP